MSRLTWEVILGLKLKRPPGPMYGRWAIWRVAFYNTCCAQGADEPHGELAYDLTRLQGMYGRLDASNIRSLC